ncbi:MAG TPA: SDR family NAD(P)-dependent oxidoreductase [Polyangia bacterium]|nr:SDR family NAD(P)-dependent oxidoreductase [Polyangia bacterium]
MSDAPRTLIVGNSDGIGLAVTRRLLAAGHAVTGVSRRASPIQAEQYTHVVADVAAADYRPTIRELAARRGPFALCIYCAGIGEPLDVADLGPDTQVFQVNLLGAVETLGAVIPAMAAGRAGHVLVLSSLADQVLSPQIPSYAASKAGLSSYLGGLALALSRHGVAITNVRFGFVDTKLARARHRPFMISVEKAVDVIMKALETRRPRVTHPLRMALLVKILRAAALLRLWLARPPRIPH